VEQIIIKENNGYTPIFDLYRNGNEDIMKYLVKLGVDINKESNKPPLRDVC